jgi:hypothetical protein
MKPLNLDNRPCSPISSNCVIWQGPDIPCIKLCTGDTVSDVVFKLATELCTIMDTLKITNYDLSCFNLAACPPQDFQELIQFLINKICELEGLPTIRDNPTSTCPDCVVNVASCFVVGTQTTMQLVDYVRMIGERVCALVNEIIDLQNQINNLDIRVTVLESAPPPVTPTPTIIINCNIGTLVSGNSYPIDQVLNQLINSVSNGYCSLISVLGTPSEIGNSLVPACAFGTDVTTDPNWTPVPTTLAESITNAWIVICDLYSIITSGLFSTADTNSINLDFTAGVLTANIQDTGWENLEGFDFYTGSMATNKPQCRRIGNQIIFRGNVYVPINNGFGAAVPLTATNTYDTIYRSNPFIGTSGVILDAQGRILFNSTGGGAASVIPTTVLDAGTNLDNQYSAPQLIANRKLVVEQQSSSGVTGSVLLNAAVNLTILPNKTLRLAPLEVIEQEPTDMVPFIGNSLLRSLTSSFTPRSRVIDFTNFVKQLDGNMSLDQQPLNGLGGASLIIGNLYKIETYTPGDDFTNVGAAVNTDNQTFIASGTTPTTWTTSVLIPLSNALFYNTFYNNIAPSYSGAQWPAISDLVTTQFDAARASNLGGFIVRLDGLSAYVDPCTTDIKNYSCP